MNKKLLEKVRALIEEQDEVMSLAKAGDESAYDNYDEGSWVTDALKVLREIAKETKMKTEKELFEEWYVANYHDGDIFPNNRILDFNNHHGEYRDNLVNALWEAWQASASREGYKFAPVEANEDMVCAAIDVWISDKSNTYEEMYKAMINAI